MTRSTTAWLRGALAASVLTLVMCTGARAADDDKMWEFAPQEGGISIKDLLEEVHKRTGNSILYLASNKALETTKVTFTGTYRCRVSEIFTWLRAVLSYQSIHLLEMGPTGHEQWAVLQTNSPLVTSRPIFVPEENLEEYKDQDGVYIVSTLTVKKLTDTTRARNSLAQINTRGVGRINDVPGTQSFIVADYAPIVYSMKRLLSAMDISNPEFQLDFEIVLLKNAVATELEPILQDLISAAVASSPRGQPQPRGQQAFGAPERPEPVIRADPRQEAIVIYAVADDIVRIKGIITKLDAEVLLGQSNIQYYRCIHALADELAGTLNDLISGGINRTRAGGGGNQPPRGPNVNTNTAEEEVVIVADTVTNGLLIQASRTTFEDLRKLLLLLDTPRSQVLIEAALVELRVNDSFQFGVELAGINGVEVDRDRSNRGFGVSRFGLSSLEDLTGDGIVDIAIPSFGNGLTAGIFSNDQFPLIIRTLKGNSKARALSMPSLVVEDGRVATITSLQSEPFTTTDTTTAGTDRQNVEYVDVETTLSISPHISTDNYLKLHLEFTVSSFGARVSPELPPPTQSRIISTDIVVPDRSTVIMGGIISENDTQGEEGIPLLMDIPLLGHLFKNTTHEKFTTNLFLFVTPTILNRRDDADAFASLHDVTWERKLLAEKLIGEEVQIYNARWRAAAAMGAGGPETPEAELAELEDGGVFDAPSLSAAERSEVSMREARRMLEGAKARANQK